MKKGFLVSVFFIFISPAWAAVDITASVDPTDQCTVIIGFDATSEPNLVRAFALDIAVDNDVNIVDVQLLSRDYVIHPGTIVIDASGNVTNYGSPVAPQSDLPGDTLAGIGTSGVTIEMASLYAPVGPPSPNAPDKSGRLLAVSVLERCSLTVTANVSRAGSTGVVMENPDEIVTVNLPAPVVVYSCGICCYTCWEDFLCGGQQQGDATCDGNVNLADLFALKAAWGKTSPYKAPFCCADFDQSGAVNLADLFILKAGWGKTGLLPATGNQFCP